MKKKVTKYRVIKEFKDCYGFVRKVGYVATLFTEYPTYDSIKPNEIALVLDGIGGGFRSR